jgi:hypothetical protein
VVWPVLEPYLDPLGTGQVTLDGLDLAGVTPQVFHVAGAFPPQVESLVPSTARSLRILGTGFRDGDTLQVDGVTLDDLYFRRGGHSFFNIDLPPAMVGRHTLTVTDNGVSESASFDVVPCTTPQLQVANGFDEELIYSALGVDTIHADVPGHVHFCIWSLSDVPSVHPLLTLLLGNNFTDMRSCLVSPIPASGYVRVHHTMAPGKLPIGTRVYNQSVCVSHGIPFHTSNTQRTAFVF